MSGLRVALADRYRESSRAVERVLAGLAAALGAAWIVAALVLGSDAGQSVPVVLGLMYGGLLACALWAARLGVHLWATRRTPERRGVIRQVAAALAFVLCAAFVFSGAAFRVRFLLSRPALDDFVRSQPTAISAGRFRPGTRVGLFRVREAEALPGGVVRLITTPCMFDDCGLAYSPEGVPPRLGEDVYSSLGGRWYHWFRSW